MLLWFYLHVSQLCQVKRCLHVSTVSTEQVYVPVSPMVKKAVCAGELLFTQGNYYLHATVSIEQVYVPVSPMVKKALPDQEPPLWGGGGGNSDRPKATKTGSKWSDPLRGPSQAPPEV
jgi:hypothetical protein